jgi:hypothetical protein
LFKDILLELGDLIGIERFASEVDNPVRKRNSFHLCVVQRGDHLTMSTLA